MPFYLLTEFEFATVRNRLSPDRFESVTVNSPGGDATGSFR